jgi:hypothetical protein
MRTCKHLHAFKINVEIIDPMHAGLPPWMALCENCAFYATQAMQRRADDIIASKPGPKGERARIWVNLRRILTDLGVWKDSNRAPAPTDRPAWHRSPMTRG